MESSKGKACIGSGRKWLASCSLIVLAQVGMAMAQDTVTVRPSDLVSFSGHRAGWSLAVEGADLASQGQMITGPDLPPLGGGSALFGLLDINGGASLQYLGPETAGLPLSDLTRLEYCTFVESAPENLTISLQINFDDDVFDSDFSYKGRLVFEPFRTPRNQVEPGRWQCWDALAGYWWASAAPLSEDLGIENPGSLIEVLMLFPNAGFSSGRGGLILKAGANWDHFQGSVDALTIGTRFFETTIDFEQEPATRNACEKSEWSSFGFGSLAECLQFVNDREAAGTPWGEIFLPHLPDPDALPD